MPTTLPAPTAETMTQPGQTGRYRYARQLASELRGLTDPFGPYWLRPDETLDIDRWLSVTVAVYVPGGSYVPIQLGCWRRGPQATRVLDTIVEHLPGARIAEEGRHVIHWGAPEPGWTPTAVAVYRTMLRYWRERDQIWTATEVAEHLGIARDTWGGYVRRGDADAPPALGRIYETGTDGRTRLVDVWDRLVVIDWDRSRPGHGGRPTREIAAQ